MSDDRFGGVGPSPPTSELGAESECVLWTPCCGPHPARRGPQQPVYVEHSRHLPLTRPPGRDRGARDTSEAVPSLVLEPLLPTWLKVEVRVLSGEGLSREGPSR